MTVDLFAPANVGDLTLANRMVMAPMTRNRATSCGVPAAMMAVHYVQCGDAGLVVSESAPVSAQAAGYPGTPGLYNTDQAAGWSHVRSAIHSRGGRIFAQLQHCGRISHPSLQKDGALPVAPSAIPWGRMAEGATDLVALGMPFLANPDLVARFRRDLPLNEADPQTFYGGDERGYTDYPSVGSAALA